MKNRTRLATVAISASVIVATASFFPSGASAQTDTPVYGSELMTRQERVEQRQRMLNAKTDAERESVRAQHHAKMQARAKERGVTLPDTPPAQGMGAGMSGRGQGAGHRGGRNN